MKKFTFILGFFVFTAFLFLISCVSTQKLSQTSDVWTGKITGEAEGTMKIFLQDLDNAGTKKFTGEIFAKISTTNQYGGGTMRGELSGKIENKRVTGIISGDVSVSDSDAILSGEFTGELSESKGSGEWKVEANLDLARFKGKWTLEKQ